MTRDWSFKERAQFLGLMVKEEFRLYTSMVGKIQFAFFPLVITFFCFVLAALVEELSEEVPLRRLYFFLHAVVVLYGLGVGGFALMGDDMAERRIGQVHLLMESPTLQPVSFREVFLIFYVKDLLFYLVFTITPIVLGIALTIPLTGFKLASVLFLVVTLSLSFTLGLSFSFFCSTLYVSWPRAFKLVLLTLLVAILGSPATGLYGPEHVLPSLMFQYEKDLLSPALSLVLIAIFSFVALRYLNVEFGKRSGRFSEAILEQTENFSFNGDFAPFLGKEWLDLKRSRIIYPVLMSYLGPLIILSIMVWFLTDVMDLSMDFNLLFYASMLGFFSITIYGWLCLLDNPSFYEVLPVTMSQVIRAKIRGFLLLSFPISTVWLIALGLFTGEAELLWLALPVSFVTTPYTVIIAAYLTGLKTNTYLFDPIILAKFMVMVAFPLIILTFISFALEDHLVEAALLSFIVCGLMLLLQMVFYVRIEGKWGEKSFLS